MVLVRVGTLVGAIIVRPRAPGARVPVGAAAWTVAPRGSSARCCVLVVLIFSKYFYLASLTSYYTFYLISKFGVSVQSAQVHLFVFLGAVAAGTILGGPIGDRIGPEVRDLGVDPRRLSVHVRAAVRRTCSGPAS